MKFFAKYLLIVGFLFSNPVFAETKKPEVVQDGVVTQVTGTAKVLIPKNPKEKLKDKNLRIAMIDGKQYDIVDAKKGQRTINGMILQTGGDGKIRMIFRNGDQLTIPSGSSVRFEFEEKTGLHPVLEILFGDLRAVIQKNGPRSGMRIRAKSAIMGVRGTDFYVSSWGQDGGSRVVVMRGSVAIAKDEKTLASNPVEIKAGMSGTIKPGSDVVNAKVSSQDLVVIEQESKVEKDSNVEQEIAELEKKAAEMALQDIKENDPALFAKIADKNLDLDGIQSASVRNVFESAPSVEGEQKPSEKDLESGGEVYKKFRWKKK